VFTIRPGLGFSSHIRADIVADIDQIYRRFVASEKRINKNAFEKAEELEKRILAEQEKKESNPTLRQIHRPIRQMSSNTPSTTGALATIEEVFCRSP
jgi:hypothetical protein